MQGGFINAVKFYYEQVLKRPKKFYDLRPKKAEQLPNVFSTKEVELLLKAIGNEKHKSILMLIYSAGLRISEAANMRIDDVLASQMRLLVKAGKGKKDRYVILSEKTLAQLRKYMEIYKPRYWLSRAFMESVTARGAYRKCSGRP
jgi:site-specific recombinase XerD